MRSRIFYIGPEGKKNPAAAGFFISKQRRLDQEIVQ